MNPPDPNTFIREAWPHLDPGQKELVTAMLAPPVRRPEQQLGVAPESGGLARPEDKMYDSSDQLMNKALVGQPQAFQDLKNTKIDRPADLSNAYGQQTSLGGYYHQNENAPSTVAVGRGNDLGEKDDLFTTAPDPVKVARHELAHQINWEHPYYAKDEAAGSPEMWSAVSGDWASLNANPQTYELAREVDRFARANDAGHVFTSLAAAYRKGANLPPRIKAYLRRLDQPATDAAREIDDNTDGDK